MIIPSYYLILLSIPTLLLNIKVITFIPNSLWPNAIQRKTNFTKYLYNRELNKSQPLFTVNLTLTLK